MPCVHILRTSSHTRTFMKLHHRSATALALSMPRSYVQLSGFVLVKKVPGSLHFHMKSQGFSFETGDIDVSHVVHAFTFGSRPSPKRMKTLARLHPGGLAKDWADKLQSLSFISQQPEYTHEHFIQLIRTTMEPATGRPYSNYDAYEYTVHSHSYLSEMANLAVPSTKFTYHPSPMQVRSRPRCGLRTCFCVTGATCVSGCARGH